MSIRKRERERAEAEAASAAVKEKSALAKLVASCVALGGCNAVKMLRPIEARELRTKCERARTLGN